MKIYLSELLKERGLTEAQFANLLRVSRSMVSHWRSGRQFPTEQRLDAMADALGVEPYELFMSPGDRRVNNAKFMAHLTIEGHTYFFTDITRCARFVNAMLKEIASGELMEELGRSRENTANSKRLEDAMLGQGQ